MYWQKWYHEKFYNFVKKDWIWWRHKKKYWFFYSDLNNLCRKSVEREKCFKKYEFSKNRLRNLIGLKKIEKTEKGLQLQKNNNNNIKWEE